MSEPNDQNQPGDPSDMKHRTVETNGITIHYVEQGEGPLVVFCHGFPESWYSWRHQLPAVAEAGFRAVALSMRGYGRTDAPTDVERYSIMHLIGDVVGVVRSLGQDRAVVVGHDWGAPVAWYSALTRPDMFRAVAALSVPFTPPIGGLPDGVTINDLMRMNAGPDRDYYRLYFQEPGVAEADLEADLRHSVLGFLYAISGDAVANGDLEQGWDGHFPMGQTLSEQLIVPETLPSWLTEDDVQFYVDELVTSGFRGGLNWYRNINRLPGLLSPWVGSTIEQPSFYMGGSTDLIAGNTQEALDIMQAALPDLRHFELIDGAGHWLQQERPAEVNRALLTFLAGL
ncbi:MAG: alpha/beta hydrolase [Acidimicrobiales bacterium]